MQFIFSRAIFIQDKSDKSNQPEKEEWLIDREKKEIIYERHKSQSDPVPQSAA